MAPSYYWLPKFDPYADFEVSAWPQGFTVNGYQPKPGEPFDKTTINSPRVLEEMYVKRWIAVASPPMTAVAQVLEQRAKRGPGRPRKNAAA
jgi:hypothetical protein